MADELPIYSNPLSRGNPFPALDRLEGVDLAACFERFDQLLNHGEGAANVGRARQAMTEPGKAGLLAIHRTLFEGREGAGRLRQASVSGIFPGQDCPEPEFIERSLANLDRWLSAESFGEIHPIEQAALSLVRLVDIWPFDNGNRSVAVVFANHFLSRAGFPPFFVLGGQLEEFDEALARAVRMDTAPLVRAIYRCMERELDRVRR